MTNPRVAAAIAIILTVLAAGCTGANEGSTLDPSLPGAGDGGDIEPQAVRGTPGAVGGRVANSPPTVESFTPSATQGENRGGFAVVFSGSVKDRNAEGQIANLTVTGVSAGLPTLGGAPHAVTAAERAAGDAPATFGADGWKVWTGVRNDGVLHYEFRQAFPAFTPAGAYSFTLRVADAPGLVATSGAIPVTLSAFSDITIAPTPVDASGAPLVGSNWGEWTAEAGAQDVESANFLKLVNSGSVADARVVIDLADAFEGAEDANFTIPVAGNVQFAWAQGPATAKPSDLQFTYGAAGPEGAVTVQFSAADNVLFVKYRIVQLPEILPVQSYGISFTVTEL